MKASIRLRVDKTTSFEAIVHELVNLIPVLGQKTLSEINFVHKFHDQIVGEQNTLRLVDGREYDTETYSSMSRNRKIVKAEDDLQLLEREAKAEIKPKSGYIKI